MRGFAVCLAVMCSLWGVGPADAGAATQPVGTYSEQIETALRLVPAAAPVALVRYVPNLLPGVGFLVVGTREYSESPGVTSASKLWFFEETADGMKAIYGTDMDERVSGRGLPSDFDVILYNMEIRDIDDDKLAEVLVWWNTEPADGISLTQYSRALHIIDYDAAASSLSEITADQVVYNQYTEDALLLDIDGDAADEIIVFDEIWESDTCVECPKRYEVTVWTVSDGCLVRDQSWHEGTSVETQDVYSVMNGDLPAILAYALRAR